MHDENILCWLKSYLSDWCQPHSPCAVLLLLFKTIKLGLQVLISSLKAFFLNKVLMNYSALDLMHTCRRQAARILQGQCMPTAVELAPFGTYFGSQSLIVGSEVGLQEHTVEWQGQRSAVIRYLHLHVMNHCIRICALASVQYPSSLCKIWGDETPFWQS